jgi:hypothetical protein
MVLCLSSLTSGVNSPSDPSHSTHNWVPPYTVTCVVYSRDWLYRLYAGSRSTACMPFCSKHPHYAIRHMAAITQLHHSTTLHFHTCNRPERHPNKCLAISYTEVTELACRRGQGMGLLIMQSCPPSQSCHFIPLQSNIFHRTLFLFQHEMSAAPIQNQRQYYNTCNILGVL